MNTTKIKLLGNGCYICVSGDFDDTEEYDFVFILESLQVLQKVNDEWVDITEQKGKYIKSKFIREEIKNYLPYELMLQHSGNGWDIDFEFDIEHEGEFNPKLLQLIKSDHEFDTLPEGINAYSVMYDGEEFSANDYLESPDWISLDKYYWAGDMYKKTHSR